MSIQHSFMRKPGSFQILACLLLLALLITITSLQIFSPFTDPKTVAPITVAPDLGQLALSFVPNVGQTDSSVYFQAHGMGGMLFFTQREVVLALATTPAETQSDLQLLSLPVKPSPVATTSAALRMQFEDSNPAPEIVGGLRTQGTVNYFIGDDPAKWHTDLPTYANIVYRQIYPGIDLRYEGEGSQLKATYAVAPGADSAGR